MRKTHHPLDRSIKKKKKNSLPCTPSKVCLARFLANYGPLSSQGERQCLACRESEQLSVLPAPRTLPTFYVCWCMPWINNCYIWTGFRLSKSGGGIVDFRSLPDRWRPDTTVAGQCGGSPIGSYNSSVSDLVWG